MLLETAVALSREQDLVVLFEHFFTFDDDYCEKKNVSRFSVWSRVGRGFSSLEGTMPISTGF